MTRKQRQQVYDKFNGRCAYTGKPLGDDWQVDHVESIQKLNYIAMTKGVIITHSHIDNLLPALRIVNHYKRSLDLEGFRDRMMDFHKRLARLPKRTSIEATRKRIGYMSKVAEAFDITPEKPFCGKFYFETLKEENHD